MELIKHVQKRVRQNARAYNVFLHIYFLFKEVPFFFHAIFTGKLFVKYHENHFSEFISKQKILEYPLSTDNLETADDFRKWLEKNRLQYSEGGWTFYLPPQENLHKFFRFLPDSYPADSGLKILKDFRPPDKARYTNRRLRHAPGAHLKRLLSHSPISLVRVANYLYAHNLGIRVYDLVVLKGKEKFLTCYVVRNIHGPDVQQEDYDSFIRELNPLLELGEIATIHERTDIMWDFKPPDCSGNLIMSEELGMPLYVDFQGFLLMNENTILDNIVHTVKDRVHFGRVRFYRRGKKYLYQSIPGLAIGKRDIETRWRFFLEMMEQCHCSFENRVVYDIGCNTGLILYNALSEGAQWGVGWDLPDVVSSSEQILLALGATRFDLFGHVINENTDFVSQIPERYKKRKNGFLFFLAVSNHIGFPEGIGELPWEYMFYEGHAKQTYETALECFRSVSWLKNAEILSYRCFADGDTPERVVILLRRPI